MRSSVWDGFIVDSVWGSIKGIGALLGYQGFGAMEQSWKGLAELGVGLESYGFGAPLLPSMASNNLVGDSTGAKVLSMSKNGGNCLLQQSFQMAPVRCATSSALTSDATARTLLVNTSCMSDHTIDWRRSIDAHQRA